MKYYAYIHIFDELNVIFHTKYNTVTDLFTFTLLVFNFLPRI